MKKWLLILGLSHLALGQAVSYSTNVTQTAGNVPPGASAPVMTVPNAQIWFCAYPPTGNPCTNTVAVFQDQAMTNPFTQPIIADPKGRVGPLWDVAGQYFVSVQTQSGVNVGSYPLTLGGTGGGGGGAPGGTTFNAQYQLNSTTFGGSKATFDAAGNFNSLSLDGLKQAFLNQTTPTSNNAIQNSLQQIHNFVISGPDYASVEGIYGNGLCPNYRLAIGCPPPFVNSTELRDYRPGTYGSYTYNPQMDGGGTWFLDRTVWNQVNQGTGSGIGYFPLFSDFELTGSCKNGFEGGGPCSISRTQENMELMIRGIYSLNRKGGQLYSQGDYQVQNNTFTVNRGSSDASGEGFQTIRNDITQNVTPVIMTANANTAAGATLIAGTRTGNVPFVGDGTYYIDSTKGGSIFHITGTTDPGTGCTAGTWTVDSTLTPDNIGCSSAVVHTPTQYYGATTDETFTVTGLTSAIVTSATVCVADTVYQESAHVVSAGAFSGGTQTITVSLRYQHNTAGGGFIVAQGSHACNFVEGRANEVPGSPPGRQLFRLIGVSAAHTMLYSRTVFGHWNLAPTGFFTSELVAAAGVTLTRNGSNVTSVNVTDPFKHFTANGIIVANCSDSTFNGTFTISSDNGSVATWPNTGGATTTTCTSAIELISRMSGTGVREAQEFPGAEIVNTNDPVTFALCSQSGSCSVEPNTNFQVAAGDVLENHIYSDVNMQFDHNNMDFLTQNAPLGQPLHQDGITGEIPEGTIFQQISFQDFPVHYQGLGGTKKIGNVLYEFGNNRTPFSNLWDLLPPPAGTAFSFNGCLYGCGDIRSTFQLFSIPINGGSYTETIHQDTGSMIDLVQGASGTLNLTLAPASFSTVADNGTSNGIAVIQPGSIAFTTAQGGGVNSHLIQTPTGMSFDKPSQILPEAFALLPACNSGAEGSMASVNDSTVNTWGTAIAGGGTNHVLAYCDAVSWTVMGK